MVGVKDLMTLACQAEGREVIGEGGEERAGLDSARRRRFPVFFFLVSGECVNNFSIWEGRLFSLSLRSVTTCDGFFVLVFECLPFMR